MRHVVLWSGGVDSTWTALSILDNSNYKEKINFNAKDDELVLLSIEHANTSMQKVIGEGVSKEFIFKKLRKRFPDVNITYNEVAIYVDSNLKGEDYSLSQPIFWIFNVYPFLKRGDKVYFSYIGSDSASSFIEYLKELNTTCSKIQGFFNYDKVEFVFPFIGYNKSDIIYSFDQSYPEILELCHFCELSRMNDCGQCHSCQDMKAALISLYASGIKCKMEVANKLLEKFFDIRIEIKELDEVESLKSLSKIRACKEKEILDSETIECINSRFKDESNLRFMMRNYTSEELQEAYNFLKELSKKNNKEENVDE